MTTLICPCGSRLNVRGMSPGKSGLCPSCGAPVRVPGPPGAAPVIEDEWNWEGTYGVEESPAPPSAVAVAVAVPSGTVPDRAADETAYIVAEAPPPRVAKTLVATPERRDPPAPEPWFPPPLLFPIRGLEGMVMVCALGAAFWVVGTLVPEYCLALLADSEKLGTPLMGYLVSLVTAMPVIFLSPLAFLYWLQYLARIVVSAAAGERNPPRPPDRNADGLFSGLIPWLVWLVLGLGVGLLPVGIGSSAGVRDLPLTLALGLGGLPYALMALLLTFLHDEDLAARPWRVIAALARVGPSFLILSLTVAGTLGAGGAAFWLVLKLRESHFWLYVAASLPCWFALVALTFVALHTLGSYYYARQAKLRWRRPAAWWNAR